MVQRFFFNIASRDIDASKAFYMGLLSMRVHFDSDWFVILKPEGDTPFELGIIDRDHEIVPSAAKQPPQGVYPTFVVDDVEETHVRAMKIGAQIIEPPRKMFYGQLRMLVRDPDGLVIDVSSVIS